MSGVPPPETERQRNPVEAALDRFLDTHSLADVFAGGWSVRLEPVRAVPVASRHFPGIPDDLPTRPGDNDAGAGPTAVLTIGQMRVARAVPFFRASNRAEAQVAEAPGSVWATGFANVTQRVVSTFSLWETAEQMRAYATSTSGHSDAIRQENGRSFHHAGSFVRFRPFAATGTLSGRNPLPERVATLVNAGA